jgi:hypothetical protein
MDFSNLFNITWTPLNISLVAAFIVVMFVGFYIIFKDIKIIKQKNEITRQDYVFSMVFGIIFSAAIMLGVLVVIQYSSRVQMPFSLPPVAVDLPRFTTVLFLFLLAITIAYPFLEFLFMAFKVKQSSPFMYQEFLFKKVVSRTENKKIRFALVTALYAAIFVAGPVLLTLANIPLIVGAITIFQLFPVFLISKLGSDGFYWGINLHFYNIFEKDRFMYTLFDDKDKAMAQFRETPVPIIIVPGMIYVYINTYISLVQMLIDPFLGNAQQSTFTFTFLFSTFTNVLIALTGYYNKYWRKEIKYKFDEILFAGYMMASLSLNILITFLVKEPTILVKDLAVAFSNDITIQNYTLFLPAAMIQRVVFGAVVTYYMFRGSTYKKNVLGTIMMQAHNRLMPRFLLNFLRHADPGVRADAARMLDEMYKIHSLKYVPPPQLKKKQNILAALFSLLGRIGRTPKRMQAPFKYIFDALGSDHPEIRAFACTLFKYMIADDPDQFIALFMNHFADRDDVKVKLLLGVASTFPPALVPKIDAENLLDRIMNGDVEVRATGFTVLPMFWDQVMQAPAVMEKALQYINSAIDSPSIRFQASCLEFLGKIDVSTIIKELPVISLLAKIDHPSLLLKERAVGLLDKILTGAMDETQIDTIMRLLENKNPNMQLAALKALNAITVHMSIAIPAIVLYTLLKSTDRNVKIATVQLVARLIDVDSEVYPVSLVVPVLESGDAGLITILLQSIGDAFVKFPDIFLPTLASFLELKDIEMKDVAKKYLVLLGRDHFEKVLDLILNVKEDARFSVRNFTREILFEIGKQIPELVIPFLHATLVPEHAPVKNFGGLIPNLNEKLTKTVEKTSNENFRVNAASVIGDLGELHPDMVSFKALLECMKTEQSTRVRQALAASLGKLVGKIEDAPVDEYLDLFRDAHPTVKAALAKGLLDLAKLRPTAIGVLQIAEIMTKETDETTREALIKTIGQLGPVQADDAIPCLIVGLQDDKWPVKNAAAEAMGKLAETIPDRVPVILIKAIMLEDKDKWARWQAAKTLSKIVKAIPDALQLKEIAGSVDISDDNLAMAYVELLRYVPPDPMELFLKDMDILMDANAASIQEGAVVTFYVVHGKTKSELLLSTLLKIVIDKDLSMNKKHVAARALGKIAQYDKGEIRKRVKKVLNAQCQQTRDPVICKESSSLE